MPIPRQALIGAPHAYLIEWHTAFDHPCFAQASDRERLGAVLASIQTMADLRIHGWSVTPQRWRVVLVHREQPAVSPSKLRERWRAAGGSPTVADAALTWRVTSLSGLSQLLAQRASRSWHAVHGGSGAIWNRRYRSCLLADDTALLAARAWLAQADPAPPASCQIADPPLRLAPGGGVMPADEAPLSLPPPQADDLDLAWADFTSGLDDDDLATWDVAFNRAWTVGRPESLTEAAARLGRPAGGRGRHRRVRELDDSLGLCGIWG